ncbi:hypothetical protein HNQ51_001670 [Inhella inkyongensis]|uniref:Uncharacterized protein n=1 Tax=Inhella inkyongensis TaxID=392593 RepID=A0A840S5R6_9BURK|nr:hypothetical protein [Inhella inkyongensis]MBB5204356.1 hypothetical protein [Inhella inkyongensis]
MLAVLVAAVGLAFLFGLLATTGSPILIALFAGTLAGLALLGVPKVTLCLVLVGTLCIGGPIVQFVPKLTKINWLFSMLGFLLFASAVLSALSRRERRQGIPWWAVLALLMPLYAVWVALVNQLGLFEFLAGFKRYFQYWGVLACLALIPLGERLHRCLLKFLLGLAAVQVVFALFQRVVIVPQRQGMGGGVVAIDAVSGTFESSFSGGGSSSVLVFFLLTAFAFVFRAWLDHKVSGRRALLYALLVLPPLALGETKVVVVFLPLVFLCALALDLRSKPITTLMWMMLGVAMALGLALLYVAMSAKTGQSFARAVDNILAYNFGSVGYHSATNLNRSTVLSFWWSQQHLGDPVGLLFGHGPGASYSGDGALVPGQLALRYFGLSIAFTTLSSLLWDFGVMGFVFFLAFNLGAIAAVARAAFKQAPGWTRSLQVAVLAGLSMNLVLFFLNNSATTLPSHSTLFMLLLGAAVLLTARPVRPDVH